MDARSKKLVEELGEDNKVTIEAVRKESTLIDGHLLKPNDRIYELVEMVDGNSSLEAKQDREIIVIDGRVYERMLKPEDKVYDLVDILEKGSGGHLQDSNLNDEIMRRVIEITQKIAREMVPEIAERVIREEIDKLKR
ncbi:MAG TPA: hypothetical protein VEF33_08845 [Syntrophales bacterium]|nr:hypothetical protein [Syntrophales bacterium]